MNIGKRSITDQIVSLISWLVIGSIFYFLGLAICVIIEWAFNIVFRQDYRIAVAIYSVVLYLLLILSAKEGSNGSK